MIKLRGGKIRCANGEAVFGKIIKNSDVVSPLRENFVYICTSTNISDGYSNYLVFEKDFEEFSPLVDSQKLVIVEDEFSYLDSNDVVKIDKNNQRISTFYRHASRDNYLLVTEQCNHYCLMCSQPPKNVDDGWIVDDILEAIPFISEEASMIGLTGGEPTLQSEKFLEVINSLAAHLPHTYVHILSNGRSFLSKTFTQKYALSSTDNFCLGIPLYSDDEHIHNYIVQSKNAYFETIKGILNLKRYGKKVEIRVVLTKQNYKRLPQLAEFISKNLLFVDHVAFMGLEVTGFAKANFDKLWIDPVHYNNELSTAVSSLRALKMNVSVFNHQLCTVDKGIWDVCRKSISDWKNEYMDICANCFVKEECGGFFATSTMKRSDYLKAITEE